MAALHEDPKVSLFLTPRFRERLKMIDSLQFGISPINDTMRNAVVGWDVTFVKTATKHNSFIYFW